jgi:1-pyrroline-5-carboxylate dehydrogenase
MTAEPQAKPRIKITYATLRADNEELHALYDAGLERAKRRLGQEHRNWIGGRERDGDGTFELRSPIDRDWLVGTFAKGTAKDVQDAVDAARKAQPAWFALGWEKRLEIRG